MEKPFIITSYSNGKEIFVYCTYLFMVIIIIIYIYDYKNYRAVVLGAVFKVFRSRELYPDDSRNPKGKCWSNADAASSRMVKR